MPKIKIKTKIKLDRKAARKFEEALAEAGLTPEVFLEVVVREGIEVLAGSVKGVETEVKTKLGFEKDAEKDEVPADGAAPEAEPLEEAGKSGKDVKEEGEARSEPEAPAPEASAAPAAPEEAAEAPKASMKKTAASKGRTRKARRAPKA